METEEESNLLSERIRDKKEFIRLIQRIDTELVWQGY